VRIAGLRLSFSWNGHGPWRFLSGFDQEPASQLMTRVAASPLDLSLRWVSDLAGASAVAVAGR